MGSPAVLVATITIIFSALSFIALCLRLFARYYIIKAVGLDDYFIMGLYRMHCDLYAHSNRGLVVAQTIAFVLAAAFHCPPSNWSHNPVYLLSCAKGIKAFTLATGALNILTDVLTFALPIPVLLKLQMPMKQKAYVIFILALGLIACVASIVRLVYSTNLMQFPPDIVSVSGTFYWTSIEMNVAIVASSIPSFKAIASRYLPGLIGYSSRESPMPLVSRNANENSHQKRLRRPTHSIGASILYDGDRSSRLPTSSQERIHVPESMILTEVAFKLDVERAHNHG
ncbi:hypothetical protein BDV36DRAFT_287301 [Aspergillus pseudocaelatus]|uniref:Rhodopsin domain-containing protein n=1 Tax=Aspergillus pseudocaelatus TaxID=1825620 RepID=A0ABQ6W7M4_9EURO|nr:hypothetical protein BDV36DRAFT_287301 [Aspergillus pseudocaelatus]